MLQLWGPEARVLKNVAKFPRACFFICTTWYRIGKILLMGVSSFFGNTAISCSMGGVGGVFEVVIVIGGDDEYICGK